MNDGEDMYACTIPLVGDEMSVRCLAFGQGCGEIERVQSHRCVYAATPLMFRVNIVLKRHASKRKRAHIIPRTPHSHSCSTRDTMNSLLSPTDQHRQPIQLIYTLYYFLTNVRVVCASRNVRVENAPRLSMCVEAPIPFHIASYLNASAN
jgi:hypothetical protein